AARHLGWSVGAVKSRLERGRELLRRRLTRRGITLGAGLLATLATENSASALPGPLAAATARGALAFVAGRTAGISTAVAGLARAAVRDLLWGRLRGLALVVLLACVTAGTGAWAYTRAVAPADATPSGEAPAPGSPKSEEAPATRSDRQ